MPCTARPVSREQDEELLHGGGRVCRCADIRVLSGLGFWDTLCPVVLTLLKILLMRYPRRSNYNSGLVGGAAVERCRTSSGGGKSRSLMITIMTSSTRNPQDAWGLQRS